MRAEKIDLLVHPGFGAIVAEKKLNVRQTRQLKRYRERAMEIAAEENRFLIAVLLYDKSLRSAYRSGKVEPSIAALYDTITGIEEALGDRCISVGSAGMTEVSTESRLSNPFFTGLRRILKGRNISIPRSASAAAFGETMMTCVPGFAANFHHAFQLKNPVSINLHYCNTGVRPRESRLKEAVRLAAVAPELQERFRQDFGDALHVNPAVPGITLEEKE